MPIRWWWCHSLLAFRLAGATNILQFNAKTVYSGICVGTTVKTNHDIQFTTHYYENQERARRADEQQQQEQQEEKECTPAVKCGVLYFPTNTEDILDHLITLNSNLYSVMMEQNVLSLAVGSRGRLAKAIVKGAHDRHRRRSKYSPSAYLIRRVSPSRASAGVATKEAAIKNKLMYSQSEMFSQSVLSLLSLNPQASTLQDSLEILLRDLNHVCGTNFKTKRQELVRYLIRRSRSWPIVKKGDKDEASSYQLMRSGVSPDARGVLYGYNSDILL